MRLVKLIILLLITSVTQAQIVQPMGYKDYGFPWQVNIGATRLKTTEPSAHLAIGDSVSKRGILFPRVYKDSIRNPAFGLVAFDIPTKKIVWWDGTAWHSGDGADSLATAQIQSDFAQTNTISADYIKNKPKAYSETFFGSSLLITLSKIPLQNGPVEVYIGPVKLNRSSYSLTNNQILINQGSVNFPIEATDKIEVTYQSTY